MTLEEKIIAELTNGSWWDTELAGRTGGDIDMIRKLLATLGDKGAGGKWSLRRGFDPSLGKGPEAARILRLLKYFIDCVALDSSVPGFTPDDAERRVVFPARGDAWNDETWWHGASVENITPLAKGHAPRIAVGLVALRETGRNGSYYTEFAPILLSRPMRDISLSSAQAVLAEGLSLNATALRLIYRNAEPESLTDIISEVSERLGLGNETALEELPALSARLAVDIPHINWRSADSGNLLEELCYSSFEEPALFTTAMLLSSPRETFTDGLLTELEVLATSPSMAAQDSALRYAMGGEAPSSPAVTALPLIEPMPLNSEQRLAVESALTHKWTEIQGPPGTGKSQVVAAILANAAWRGQKVLLASKNNAAVDVVVARLNAMADRPGILRVTGSSDATPVLNQINRLLGGSTTEKERMAQESAIRTLKGAHAELTAATEALGDADRRLADLVDCKAKSLVAKERLGAMLFADPNLVDTKRLRELIPIAHTNWERADRARNVAFVRIFWPLFRGKRFTAARQSTAEFARLTERIGGWITEQPDERTQDSSASVAALHRIVALGAILEDLLVAAHHREVEMIYSASPRCEAVYERLLKAQQAVHAASAEAWRTWLYTAEDRLSAGARTRLGTLQSLHRQVSANRDSVLKLTWAQYYRALESSIEFMPLWATTSLSVGKRLPLRAGCFDLIIIDEASQCDIASALPLLYRAKRVVILGDTKQLSHISNAPDLDVQLMSAKHRLELEDQCWSYNTQSLLDLSTSLDLPSSCKIALREHFRCHPEIIGYSNAEFYEHRLLLRTNVATLRGIAGRPPISWVDVPGKCRTKEGTSLQNLAEAEAVIKEVKRVLDEGNPKQTVGVCTPFRAQVDLLKALVAKSPLEAALDDERILLGTVHTFQGNERDVMIFSPVLAEGATDGSKNFLSRTTNLFNVAVTRARAHMIVVGDRSYCVDSGVGHLARFVDYCSASSESRRSLSVASDPVSSPTDAVGELERLLHSNGFTFERDADVDQYRISFALELGRSKIALEVDTSHDIRLSDPTVRRDDFARWERLSELGWRLVRFAPYEITEHPQRVLDSLRAFAPKTK